MKFHAEPEKARVLLIFCVSIMLVAAVSGCVKKPQDVLIKPESKQLVPSKVDQEIIKLVTESYIPYSYMENGELKGIAVDVVSEAFKRQGYEVDLTVLPWTRALQMIEDGDADGIFCAFYSEKRAIFMQYLKEPIAQEAQFVYTLKDSPVKFDGTLDSLKPYRIGVLQDYFFGEAFDRARKDGSLHVEAVTDLPTDIQKLLDGRIDAMVDHHLSTLYYLKQMNVQDRIVEQSVPFREPAGLYLAFTKKRFLDQALILKIDEELVAMKADGTYQKIMDRYIR